MQSGYDLQRVSVNARVPATAGLRPALPMGAGTYEWACVGVLGSVPSDM